MKQPFFRSLAILFMLMLHSTWGHTFTVQNPQNDDVWTMLKLNTSTLNWWMQTSRMVQVNLGQPDILSGKYSQYTDQPLQIQMQVAPLNTPKLKPFVDILKRQTGVQLEQITTTIVIPEVQYEIDNIYTEVTSSRIQDQSLVLDLKFSIDGFSLFFTQGIHADMVATPLNLEGGIHPFQVHVPEQHPLDFYLQVRITEQNNKSELKTEVISLNFDSLQQQLKSYAKSIQLKDKNQQDFLADSFWFHPIEIRLGDARRQVTIETLTPFLNDQIPLITQAALEEVANFIEIKPGQELFQANLPARYTVGYDDAQKTNEQKLNAQKLDAKAAQALVTDIRLSQLYHFQAQHFTLGFNTDFCTTENYLHHNKQCFKTSKNQIAAESSFLKKLGQRTPEEVHLASVEANDILANDKTVAVISLSETMLNKAITATRDLDFWSESLDDMNLSLGAQGAMIFLNPKTKTTELVLHLEYVGKGLERIVASHRRPLTFPLRIQTETKILPQENGIPRLMVTAVEMASSLDEIIHGIPEWNMNSKMRMPFLKKTIGKTVLKMAQDILGTTLFEIDLPQIKNTSLDKTELIVSPHGRLNIVIKQ